MVKRNEEKAMSKTSFEAWQYDQLHPNERLHSGKDYRSAKYKKNYSLLTKKRSTMIKAQELRIGNVIWDDTRQKPKWVSRRVINDLSSSVLPLPYSPIILSPEIAKKAGFEIATTSNEYWTHWVLPNGWHISESHHNEPSAGVEEGKFYRGEDYIHIKSLHHLQNFYYVHTDQELDIHF